MPSQSKIPVPTLERLAKYLTVLSELKSRNIEKISSTEIEECTSINAAQFRKDLSYFGEFGRPGIGYNIQELYTHISKILNLEKTQPIILVGTGNLGSALAGYPSLRDGNFKIVAAFDNNSEKIGQKIWDLTVEDISTMAERNAVLKGRVGIIAVPASAAQKVAENLVKANVMNILNFAPTSLKMPQNVTVRNVDFVQELAVLSFHLSKEC